MLCLSLINFTLISYLRENSSQFNDAIGYILITSIIIFHQSVSDNKIIGNEILNEICSLLKMSDNIHSLH